MKTKFLILIILAVFTALLIVVWKYQKIIIPQEKAKNTEIKITPTLTPTQIPIKKDTFNEKNKKYGPCTKINVLTYHHIQKISKVSGGDKNLTVDTEMFRKQMQYLKDKDYSVIGMEDLQKFLENGINLPAKPVLITVDDAYDDNYLEMFPVLKEFGFKATIFTPTGLVDNTRYLSWQKIEEMKNSGLIYFGNHTWSHHGSNGTTELQDKEIGLADRQLTEKNLNLCKAFAYPYGKPSLNAEKALEQLGYKIAFTTTYGNLACKGQSLEIPRIRIGNAQLNNYGL